jgi:glycosyltransferase involved in cell wall biosynthesis
MARLLECFDAVWTTNEMSREVVTDHFAGPTKLVSPYSPGGTSATRDETRAGDLVASLFCYRGDPLYGAELAVEAVRLLRAGGYPWHLNVVAYGGPTSESERLREQVRGLPWVRYRAELSEGECQELLTASTLLLRPTSTDGDAMIVREALAIGCRVLASSVVPRPRSVELVDVRTPQAWAAAITSGGRVSTGDGLGEPVDVVLLREVLSNAERE